MGRNGWLVAVAGLGLAALALGPVAVSGSAAPIAQSSKHRPDVNRISIAKVRIGGHTRIGVEVRTTYNPDFSQGVRRFRHRLHAEAVAIVDGQSLVPKPEEDAEASGTLAFPISLLRHHFFFSARDTDTISSALASGGVTFIGTSLYGVDRDRDGDFEERAGGRLRDRTPRIVRTQESKARRSSPRVTTACLTGCVVVDPDPCDGAPFDSCQDVSTTKTAKHLWDSVTLPNNCPSGTTEGSWESFNGQTGVESTVSPYGLVPDPSDKTRFSATFFFDDPVLVTNDNSGSVSYTYTVPCVSSD